jgi:hypothetical protein
MIGLDDAKIARLQMAKNSACNEYHVLHGIYFL